MVLYNGPVPGASAGPAGEHTAIRAIRNLGYMTAPMGIDSHLNPWVLDMTRGLGANLPWLPDIFVYNYGIQARQRPWVAAVEVKGVRTLHDDPMRFLVPRRNVDSSYDYMANHRHWVLFCLVPWNGWDIRIATPAEIETMPLRDYWDSYEVDGARLPTLAEYLADPPPSAHRRRSLGAALARG